MWITKVSLSNQDALNTGCYRDHLAHKSKNIKIDIYMSASLQENIADFYSHPVT